MRRNDYQIAVEFVGSMANIYAQLIDKGILNVSHPHDCVKRLRELQELITNEKYDEIFKEGADILEEL